VAYGGFAWLFTNIELYLFLIWPFEMDMTLLNSQTLHVTYRQSGFRQEFFDLRTLNLGADLFGINQLNLIVEIKETGASLTAEKITT
jgi:hypothetical protein